VLAKESSSYGAPFLDDAPVANPTTEQSAALYNRHAEDSAQMTRTATGIKVKFETTTTAGPISVSVVDSTSVWGEGIAFQPTISKTATGTYVITYATEYDDALVGTEGNEGVAETEQVSFRFGHGGCLGSTFGHVQPSFSNNVITTYVFDAAGALSDLGGGVVCQVFAR
jgi:hypothetical protein